MSELERMILWILFPIAIFVSHAAYIIVRRLLQLSASQRRIFDSRDASRLVELLARSFLLVPILLCCLGLLCWGWSDPWQMAGPTMNSGQLVGDICGAILCLIVPLYLFALHWALPDRILFPRKSNQRTSTLVQALIPYAQWLTMMPFLSLWKVH